MNQRFHYSTLHEFNAQYYKDLLTNSHISDDRKPIKVHDETHIFYPLRKDRVIYALPEEHIRELPILVTDSFTQTYYGKVYDIITSFKSAKFRPEKHFEFRQVVEDLCDFEHEEPQDFVAWKIMALAALLGRCVYRVSSPPAFGKDSVMKVLGYLTSNVVVIANPTVPKLEYRLSNKVIMLNEFANLNAESRSGMEHFLQSVGDDSNTYEKQSRASQGTTESYDIGELSVVAAYNDKDCYPTNSKYFDDAFGKQTLQRYIPIKFKGKIKEQIKNVGDPKKAAEEHGDYLQKFMRTLLYYKDNWREELQPKKSWKLKTAKDYGLKNRWANNYDRIRDFVMLYSETPEEAQGLLNLLWNRHVDYMKMVRGNYGLDQEVMEQHPEQVTHEDLFLGVEDVVIE
jgi:hypothetical protein